MQWYCIVECRYGVASHTITQSHNSPTQSHFSHIWSLTATSSAQGASTMCLLLSAAMKSSHTQVTPSLTQLLTLPHSTL
jgi:hypothetical protein